MESIPKNLLISWKPRDFMQYLVVKKHPHPKRSAYLRSHDLVSFQSCLKVIIHADDESEGLLLLSVPSPSGAHHWVHQCRPVRKARHCTVQTVLPLSNKKRKKSPAVCERRMIPVGILHQMSSNEISQCQPRRIFRLKHLHMDVAFGGIIAVCAGDGVTRVNIQNAPRAHRRASPQEQVPRGGCLDGQRVKLL